MLYIFKFPDIGEGLEEGIVAEWMVKKGQAVESGDILVTMETDKVVAEIPSPKTGIIKNLFGKPGDVIKVGEALVEIEIEGVDDTPETTDKQETVEEEGAGVVGTLEVAGGGAVMSASTEGFTPKENEKRTTKKAKATPVARAMAKDLGINIDDVKGTGPAGRVQKKDIQEHYNRRHEIANQTNQEGTQINETPVEIENLSQIRKTIALNMVKSKHNAAHMTLFDEVEIEELVRIRAKYKNYKEGVKLTYLPFIIKAVAVSLKKHKGLNSEIDMENGKMIYKRYYNIGIAVDTDRGLVVPVIKHADKLSIIEIAEQLKIFIDKADNNQLSMDDMKDGTFTITSYGSIGGKFAVPVINYPQAAILGIGRISKAPLVKNDEVVVGHQLPLSISVDHRIVDGAEVTEFINTIAAYLNEPASLLIS